MRVNRQDRWRPLANLSVITQQGEARQDQPLRLSPQFSHTPNQRSFPREVNSVSSKCHLDQIPAENKAFSAAVWHVFSGQKELECCLEFDFNSTRGFRRKLDFSLHLQNL